MAIVAGGSDEPPSSSGPEDPDRFVNTAIRIEGRLRRVVSRYLSAKSDIDDVIQETNLKSLLAGRREQEKVDSIEGFVVTVAKNAAKDVLKKRQLDPVDPRIDLDVVQCPADGSDALELANHQQELEQFADAVSLLPPRCRQVFTLRRVYNYSQKDIAARLGISEDTVESHMKTALRRFADSVFNPPRPEGGRTVFRLFSRRRSSHE